MATKCTICARHGIDSTATTTRDLAEVSGYPARTWAPLCAECAAAYDASERPAAALAEYEHVPACMLSGLAPAVDADMIDAELARIGWDHTARGAVDCVTGEAHR